MFDPEGLDLNDRGFRESNQAWDNKSAAFWGCVKHCRCGDCCDAWCGDCCSCCKCSDSTKACCASMFFCCSVRCWFIILRVLMTISVLSNIGIFLASTATYMDHFEVIDASYRDTEQTASEKDYRFFGMLAGSIGEFFFYVFWSVVQIGCFWGAESMKTHFRFLADGWGRMGAFHLFMILWTVGGVVDDSFATTDDYGGELVMGALFAVQLFFGLCAVMFGCCGESSLEEQERKRDMEMSPL